MAKKVKKTLKTKISPKIVKKSKPQKVVKQKKQSPKIKKPIAKPKSKSTKKLVVKTKQKKQSPKTKQPTPKAKPKKVVKTKKPIAKPKSKSTKKLVVKTKQKKQSPKTKKPTPKAKPKKVVNTKPISKQKKIKVIKQKVTKVIKPKVDLNSQYVTNEELAKRLDRIFNTKVNKKQTGEAQIRLSTLLKEVGNHEFTEDQIKFISRMLSENNVSISGRGDKYNSPLNTYLSDHNVKTKTSSDSSSSNGIIKRMFQTLAASKPLTEEDEKKYIKMLGSKNENVRKIGRENLIISNLRLVASIARKHINKGVQLEDLILEGYLGLIKTVDKFDWNATTKFSTYATWWIRQAVTRTISDYGRSIRTPIHISEQLNRIRLAEEHLTNEMGKHPSIKQISEYLGGEKAGFPEIKIIDLKRIAVTPISLEKELKDDEDSHIADFIKDDTPTPMDQVANDEMRKQIIDFLKSELDNEEYKVYTMRFGFDQESAFQQLSLDEVSKKLKFTKDKVRTIETKAKRKLQNSKSLGAMKKLFHNMYSSSQEENE